MSEKLSALDVPSSAPPGIHPPFKLGRLMDIIFPAFLTTVLPWNLLNYVQHLPFGFPGRNLWISLPGNTQTLYKPPIVFIWYILIHLLVKFPTTSYFYPFSPGFRWVSSKPSSSSPTTPSSSEAQPTPSPSLGRWRFSFAGLPSDPHPLSGDKPKSFFPYWWPILITEFPFVLCWVACITGSIGEFGDESYSRFLYWVYGVSMVCFPFVYYLARDGGALDIHGKKD